MSKKTKKDNLRIERSNKKRQKAKQKLDFVQMHQKWRKLPDPQSKEKFIEDFFQQVKAVTFL